MKKQTNVYKVSEALPFLNNTEQLMKRSGILSHGVLTFKTWEILRLNYA
jgi:hypothetical protein